MGPMIASIASGLKPSMLNINYLSNEQCPQLLGLPEQSANVEEEESVTETDAVKTESFLFSFKEPHEGHSVCPFQFLFRTRISES